MHLIARAFPGGTGTFGRLMYVITAFFAPMSIVITAMSLISQPRPARIVPMLITDAVFFYELVLNVLAIMEVHGLTWGSDAVQRAAVDPSVRRHQRGGPLILVSAARDGQRLLEHHYAYDADARVIAARKDTPCPTLMDCN